MLVVPSMQVGEVTMLAYTPIMLVSGAIELACMAVITPPVSMTLDKFVLNRAKKRPIASVAVQVSAQTNGADAAAQPEAQTDEKD